jgi:hypothetical protein
MDQDKFDKLNSLIHDELADEQALVIRSRGTGFRVNRYTIEQQGNRWSLKDQKNEPIKDFHSRKYAVLAALLLQHKKMNSYHTLLNLDQKLAIATEDLGVFVFQKDATRSETRKMVLESRIDRAKQILDNIRYQINTLEKSLQLQ